MTADPREPFQAALADRYAVERELGRGGMATVYLARDVKHRRRVALKVLHPELAYALGADRFLREIETVANLTHPHILPLHDSGEAAGLLYYVMPYVEGESLRDRLAREIQLPVEDALRIAREVADALSYAHGQGVVHRDVKPENILLSGGHALVADFGIARVVDQAAGGHLTETGMSVGTAAYMSPEQASGAQVDGRSDVYALGCVVYEMLAGEPPYTGPTAQAITIKRLSDPVPSVRRLRPAVPPPVDAAVTRALAPVPADRFATAALFAEALERPSATATTGSEAGDTPKPVALPGTPSKRRPTRYRPSAVIAGVAGVVLLTLGVLYLRQPHPRNAAASGGVPRSVAVLPFANLSGSPEQEYFSDGMTEELISVLSRVEGLRVPARTSSFAFKGQNADVREVGAKLNVASVLEGSVRRAGDRVRIAVELVDAKNGFHLWSESYDRRLADVFAVQDEVARAVVTALRVTLEGPRQARPGVGGTDEPEAHLLYLKARHTPQTPRGLTESVVLLTQAIARDSTYAAAYADLARSYATLGAMDALPDSIAGAKARVAADRALALEPNLPEGYVARAFVLSSRRDFDGAAAAIARALELKPSDALAHDASAKLRLVTEGLSKDAVQEYQVVQQLDPMSADASHNLGLVLLWIHRDARAAELFRQAIVLDSTFPWSYSSLGVALAGLQKDDEAMSMVGKALQTQPGDPDVLTDLACVHIRGGRPEEARKILRQLQERSAGEPATLYVAAIHAMLGEKDAAFRLLPRVSWDAFGLIMLRGDIRLESLRSDRRYADLLRSLGLQA